MVFYRYAGAAAMVAGTATIITSAFGGAGLPPSPTPASPRHRHQTSPSYFALAAPAPATKAYCEAPPPDAQQSDGDAKPAADRLARWRKRWEQGTTRWHRGKVDPSLQKYLESHLLPQTGSKARVLVPLAGKSVDMAYLAQHEQVSKVIGVEGIRKAMQEFASENPELEVVEEEQAESPAGPYRIWTGKSIMLLQGDFFELNLRVAGGTGGTVDAVWDRGSLVAIDPSLREQYVETLRKVLKPNDGKILLSAYVRNSGDKTKGPPFSIDEDEVRRLFEGQPWVKSVELLEVHSAGSNEPWYRAFFFWWRMGSVDEKIFLITTKSTIAEVPS